MLLYVNIMAGAVGLLHFHFMVLEMFTWAKPHGQQVFGNSPEVAKATEVLAANQGLYNGFLGAGLIWGVAHPTDEIGFQIKAFFLICAIVAGLYGGRTANPRIYLFQAFPAAIAAIMLFIEHFFWSQY